MPRSSPDSTVEPRVSQKWRHKKRGNIYEIVAIDALIQISTPEFEEPAALLEDEGWIAYRPVNGHRLYFRMREEFLDGRFDLVEDVT